MFRLRRAAGYTLTLSTVGASVGAYGTYYIADDLTKEGFERSVKFWSKSFPIYLHYRMYQLLNRDLRIISDDYALQQYDKLHEKYSDVVKDIVYGMRGFYLKNAQMLSTQDDFIPPAYMKWVKDTQDNVPTEFIGREAARNYVKLKLREEMKLEFDDVFSYWDDEPLGIASIGQVHKARLKENGKLVAVKILVPGIENKFRCDIQNIRAFCKLAMPQHVTAFDEIEKQFCTEFDYIEEARNLDFMYKAIMPRWGSMVQIPKPYTQICSKHILVMECLEGVKLVDGIRSRYKIVAEKMGKTLEQLETEQIALMKSGKFLFKSIEQSKQEQNKIQWYYAMHDYLFNINNLWKTCYNFSVMRLIYGPMEIQRTQLPVDLGSLLEVLCNVHADELFGHGAFNGDPHPGNIMLLNDGRLGLIDYGQVKRMALEERIVYAKLMIAHSRFDKEEVIRLHLEEQKVLTKRNDREIAYLHSAFFNDRDTADICQGMNIATFIDYLEAADPMVQLPEAYLLATRMSFLLRGMGKAFGLQLRMSEMWKQEAQAFLKSQGIDY